MSDDDEYRYTRVGMIGDLEVFRCYDCGALVDTVGLPDHDDWEEGYAAVVSASLRVWPLKRVVEGEIAEYRAFKRGEWAGVEL